jgi:hypothetical protein
MSKARVTFVTSHQIAKDFDGQLVGASASVRLRALVPAIELSKLGFETKVVSLHESVSKKAKPSEEEADIFIISKIFSEVALNFAFELKAKGKRVIFDFCDNYFKGGEYQNIAMRSINQSNLVLTNTRGMSIECKDVKQRIKTFIIPDLIEGESKSFSPISQSGPLHVLAFGHQLVCNHITKVLPSLAELSKIRPLRLEIVTAFNTQTITWFREITKTLPNTLLLTMTMWNEYQMTHSFRRCDIVIIPSEESDFNLTKSPNRLIESVNAGKPVVAYPLPEYLCYNYCSYITKDIAEGVRSISALADRDLELHLNAAQARAFSRHSRRLIGLRWSRVLDSLIDGSDVNESEGVCTISVNSANGMVIDYKILNDVRRRIRASDDGGMILTTDQMRNMVFREISLVDGIEWMLCLTNLSILQLVDRFSPSPDDANRLSELIMSLSSFRLIDTIEEELISSFNYRLLLPIYSLVPCFIHNEILDRLEYIDSELSCRGFNNACFERSDLVKTVIHSGLLAAAFGTNGRKGKFHVMHYNVP